MRALTAATVLVIVATSLPALSLAGDAAGTGIADTAHDFTDDASDTVGLCTFCHTPHRAQQTRLLWNHTLSSLTYGWSDTNVTVGGTDLPTFDSSWQGISKNCLSCHDGSVAIGDVSWFRASGPQNLLAERHDDADDPALIAPGGDLAGNHPVALPIPFQGVASTYNGITSGEEAVKSGWHPDPQTLGIRLFNDDGAGNVAGGAVVGQTGVECSSCHDPHNGTEVVDEFFLRGLLTGNDSSYICLKCHQK